LVLFAISQDVHNHLNSANVGAILDTPSETRANGAATSVLPNQSTNACHIQSTQPITPVVQHLLGYYSLEYVHDQLTKMLHNYYGIKPSSRTRAYQKLYHEVYDTHPYPLGFRVPKFIKFNGENNITILEPVSQFFSTIGFS
jgi:hypothetical protein